MLSSDDYDATAFSMWLRSHLANLEIVECICVSFRLGDNGSVYVPIKYKPAIRTLSVVESSRLVDFANLHEAQFNLPVPKALINRKTGDCKIDGRIFYNFASTFTNVLPAL